MKYFPAARHPAYLAGLEHSRAPFALQRKTAALAAAVFFSAGFFLGAILFGELLVHAAATTLNAQSSALNFRK